MLIALLRIALAQAPVAPAAQKPIDSLPPLVEDAQAVSPDHRRIAVSTRDGRVWVLDIATRTVSFHVPAAESLVEYITWSEDGSRLGLLHRNADVDIVNAATGAITAKLRSTSKNPVHWKDREIHFAAGGSVLIAALGGPPTDILPTVGGDRIAQILAETNSAATALAMSRDGELLALGEELGLVTIWKTRTGEQQICTMRAPAGKTYKRVSSMDFDPTGETLAIGGGDCTVRLWNRTQNKITREFSHCDADMFGDLAIGCVQFSPDGRGLLTASFTFWEFRVWDLKSDGLLDHFDFGSGAPRAMSAWFSSDQKCIVTALGCRVAPLEAQNWMPKSKLSGDLKLIPGGYPAQQAWYRHQGDCAWAVVDKHLVVRKIPDAEPILNLPIRGE